MKKDLLIGLVLGFALGAGVVLLLGPEAIDEKPPAPTLLPGPAEDSEPPEPGCEPERGLPPEAEAATPGSELAEEEAGGEPVFREKQEPEDGPEEDPEEEAPRRDRERVLAGDLSVPELAAAIERIAAGAPPPRGWDLEDWCYQLQEEAWDRDDFQAPTAVVRRLLAAADHNVRALGGRILCLAEPPAPGLVRQLARAEPDPEVREEVVSGMYRLVDRYPDLLPVILEAQEDPDSEVRATAAHNVGWLVKQGRAVLAKRLVRATKDEDSGVRERAVWFLEYAGRPGSDRAVEILAEEKYEEDLGRYLVPVVLRDGRVGEVIAGDPSPEAATALLTAMCQEGGVLDFSLEKALSLSQPEDGDYFPFFRLVAWSEDAEFFRKVISTGGEDEAVRLEALRAGLKTESLREAALAGAADLLRNPEASVRIRLRAVALLAPLLEARDAASGTAGSILRRTAKEDPSRWVRRRAKEALAGN